MPDTKNPHAVALRKSTGRNKAEKNPHAVAMGLIGGAAGGRARARKMSKKRLSEIGKRGAAARIAKYGNQWSELIRAAKQKKARERAGLEAPEAKVET